jgi:hypothetical protein
MNRLKDWAGQKWNRIPGSDLSKGLSAIVDFFFPFHRHHTLSLLKVTQGDRESRIEKKVSRNPELSL